MKPKRVALNIDWDFFFKEDEMWGWGHGESALFHEALWYDRFASAIMPRPAEYGKPRDLEKAYRPHKLYKRFFSELEALGFVFSEAPVVVYADSNLFAFPFFRAFTSINHIVSFDYHHDVAYGPLTDQVDCGNWLGQLLKIKKRLTATCVYPTQERLEEEFKLPEHESVAAIKDRVQATTFKRLQVEERLVTDIFICRSGCWTPPWGDEAFIEFASYFKGFHIQKILPEGSSKDLADPMQKRIWHHEQALEMAGQMAEVFGRTRELAATQEAAP